MNENGRLEKQNQDIKRLEGELLKQKKQYEIALESLDGGVLRLRYFPRGNKVRIDYISKGHLAIMGYTREEYNRLIKADTTIDVVIEEDRERMYQNIKNKIAGKLGDYTYYRIRTKTGNIRWLQCSSAIIEKDSESYLFQFFISDVTEMKRVQRELELERNQFEMFASITAGTLFRHRVDSDEIVYYIIEDGKKKKQVVEKFSYQAFDQGMIYPEDAEKFQRDWKQLVGEESEKTMRYRRRDEDGEYHWVQADVRVVREDGTALVVVGRITNIDELVEKEKILYEKSLLDPLTGIYNKVAFEEMCEQRLKTVDRAVLLLIDVDNFKILNDNYGHLFGDTVLVNVAEGIKVTLGESDLAGRFGGDEFIALITSEVSEEAVQQTIQKISHIFQELHRDNEVLRKITISVGASRYPEDAADFQGLFQKADFAMYRAKMNGKGEQVFYQECEGEEFAGAKKTGREVPRIHNFEEVKLNLNEEIAEYSFEILEGVKDIESALSIIMSNVGRCFDLNYISFRWIDEAKHRFILSQQWKKMGQTKKLKEIHEFEPEEFEQYIKSFEGNKVFVCQDVRQAKEKYICDWVKGLPIKSLLQCAVYERETIVGIMTFVSSDEKRVWTQQEIKTLKLMARVISAHMAGTNIQREIEEKVKWLTSYDMLTGLFKVEEFRRRGGEILKDRKLGERVALVYSDFTNFKTVNDTYGEAVGDHILREFSDYIKKQDGVLLAARDYADNIVCLFHFSSKAKKVRKDKLVERIEEVNRYFCREHNKQYPGMDLNVATGIYVFEEGENHILEGIDNANIARKLIKRERNYGVCLFESEMLQQITSQARILSEFGKALEEREFVLYLQPQVDLNTGKIAGAEALVRWIKGGSVYHYPDDFIPLLEQNGSIVELDFYMLELVLQKMTEWKERKEQWFPVSINFSRVHLYNAEFGKMVYETVLEYGISPQYIDIEITESVFVSEYSRVVGNLDYLREKGFSVSIDDFGKGYSSLNMLAEVAVDAIKLDKEFLSGASHSTVNRHIIKYMIGLAKELNMKVVCEGVETMDQINLLKEAKCEYVQGYYFDKPIPVMDFEAKYVTSGVC